MLRKSEDPTRVLTDVVLRFIERPSEFYELPVLGETEMAVQPEPSSAEELLDS